MRFVIQCVDHAEVETEKGVIVQPPQTRLIMTRIAAEGYAPFEVSEIEVNRPGNSYSYETLEEIAAQNPEAELYFIARV